MTDLSSRTLAELVSERDQLLNSIDDLDREHAAGDVDDADYSLLRERYVVRAAETIRALEVAYADTSPSKLQSSDLSRWHRFRRVLGRRGVRKLLGAGLLVAVLGILFVVIAHVSGVRLPGQSATGSIALPPALQVRQELEQASVLGTEGNLEQAVTLYDEVLASVPNQPEALAYRGWLVRLLARDAHSTSLEREGDQSIARAVAVAPKYADVHALDGVALYEDDDNVSAALVQFDAFLANHPSAGLESFLGAEMAHVYLAGHEHVPAVLKKYVPAANKSSTSQAPPQ